MDTSVESSSSFEALVSEGLSVGSSTVTDDISQLPVFRWTHAAQILHQIDDHPTCTSVDSLVAIGTASGRVFLFGFDRSLRNVLLPPEGVSGAVSAVDVSQNAQAVCVGYDTGHVALFEAGLPEAQRVVAPTTLQKAVADDIQGHLENSRVHRVSFVSGSSTAFVSADNLGLAFFHSLGKVLMLQKTDLLRIFGKYPVPHDIPAYVQSTLLNTKNRLFTKKRGRICDVQCLGPCGSDLDHAHLTAILTPSRLVIIGLRPMATILWSTSSPRAEQLETHALLAWHPAPKAILAYTFGSHISLVQVNADRKVTPHATIAMPETAAPITGLRFLSTGTLVVTRSDSLCLYATDGLLLAQERTPWAPPLFMMVSAYKDALFLTSDGQMLIAAQLSWTSRVLSLMKAGKVAQGIALVTQYYEGLRDSTTFALPDDPLRRKEAVLPMLYTVQRAGVHYAFSPDRFRDGTHADSAALQTFLQNLIHTLVRACIATGDDAFFFDQVYDIFEENGADMFFLQQVDIFLISHVIEDVPPRVAQRILQIYETRGDAANIARFVSSIDPLSLDLDQAISLCRSLGLHEAYGSLMSRALGDFVAFVPILLPSIPDLFAYLSNTARGLSYPEPVRLPPQVESARVSLYEVLFSRRTPAYLHEHLPPDGYPYHILRTLAGHEGFFSILTLIFHDSVLDKDDMEPHANAPSFDRGTIIGVLVSLLVSSPQQAPLAQRIKAQIASFIAENAARFPQFVHIDSAQVPLLLDVLLLNPGAELSCEYLLSIALPPREILPALADRAEAAGFFRVARQLFRHAHMWPRYLAAFIHDPALNDDTLFASVRDVLERHTQVDFWPVIVPDLARRVADGGLSPLASAHIIGMYFPTMHLAFAQELPKALEYTYLKMAIEDTRNVDIETRAAYLELACMLHPEHVVPYLAKDRGIWRNERNVAEARRICAHNVDALVWLENEGQSRGHAMDLARRCAAGLRDDQRALVLLLRVVQDIVTEAAGPDTEALWHDLIDMLQYLDADALQEHLGFVKKADIHSVSYPRIVHYIFEERPAASRAMPLVRFLLNAMLAAHETDVAILESALDASRADMFRLVSVLYSEQQRGLWGSLVCVRCGEPIAASDASLPRGKGKMPLDDGPTDVYILDWHGLAHRECEHGDVQGYVSVEDVLGEGDGE